MKIAVTASRPTLDADIDPRFGRCLYFVLVDSETMQYEVVQNPGSTGGGGVGIATAQFIANKGAETIITGNCGPNAYKALSAAGINVFIDITGNVQDAIESYKSGKLKASSQPNVEAHSGVSQNKPDV